MQCCANCFGDNGLRQQIIPQNSTESGDCPNCGTKNQLLVDARKLADYFELLVSIYQQDDEGKLLVELMKEDWALFPDIDQATAKEILAAILDDDEIIRQHFIPTKKSETDQLDQWEQLKHDLMYDNRFFPRTEIDKDRLEVLLSSLIIDNIDLPSDWFRARIEHGSQPFEAHEMGAPPKHTASHGRANPAGIPYLYLSTTRETAVEEVRPHPGEKVCVSDFLLGSDLQIADLRQPRTMISPFLQPGEDEIALLRGDIYFLERLGMELTIPVVPTEVAIAYVPSQYLCGFIKKCGFHGVIYASSVSEGVNLALFNPNDARVRSVEEFSILRVSVEMVGITNP